MYRFAEADGISTAGSRGSADDSRQFGASRRSGSTTEFHAKKDWTLEFAARFRARSFANTMLIFTQHEKSFKLGLVPDPMPTHVANHK